ncbi:hypothetical protein ACFOYW_04545 [Gryllotalpicola reticulitermitis]|uniref:Uncharacterized protein n=1 Tax=Gryllotalpicola reticulitermitis TaxID=1184153 RepID=A0ABV8Q5M8_9MICO
MRDGIDQLIRILDDAVERIERLAEQAVAESPVKPDFDSMFARTPEARAGQQITRLRSAAHDVAHAIRSLEDARQRGM